MNNTGPATHLIYSQTVSFHLIMHQAITCIAEHPALDWTSWGYRKDQLLSPVLKDLCSSWTSLFSAVDLRFSLNKMGHNLLCAYAHGWPTQVNLEKKNHVHFKLYWKEPESTWWTKRRDGSEVDAKVAHGCPEGSRSPRSFPFWLRRGRECTHYSFKLFSLIIVRLLFF